MFTKIIFTWMLLTGSIQKDIRADNRQTYNVMVSDTAQYTNAYKGEILNWIRTGNFVYNEDIPDK